MQQQLLGMGRASALVLLISGSAGVEQTEVGASWVSLLPPPRTPRGIQNMLPGLAGPHAPPRLGSCPLRGLGQLELRSGCACINALRGGMKIGIHSWFWRLWCAGHRCAPSYKRGREAVWQPLPHLPSTSSVLLHNLSSSTGLDG